MYNRAEQIGWCLTILATLLIIFFLIYAFLIYEVKNSPKEADINVGVWPPRDSKGRVWIKDKHGVNRPYYPTQPIH